MTDPFLLPYIPVISKRNQYIRQQESLITDNGTISLYDVAEYHLFFGLHNLPDGKGWIFREWAPNATAVYIIGMMTDWQIDERFKLLKKDDKSERLLSDKGYESERLLSKKDCESDKLLSKRGYESEKLLSEMGIWEKSFPEETFRHGDLYRLKIFWNNGEGGRDGGDRIPTCATRVVQDPDTLIFNAQVWNPEFEYKWKNSNFKKSSNLKTSLVSSDSKFPEPLLIYEAHAGMAQEEGRVGSFREFEAHILPRIKEAGYNAIQLMAVQEHPYYGSFGYHVSNFFALSSRFGTPHDFKSLVDAAHGSGIKVIIDIVHSHAVSNEVEGLSRFDGTLTQFFHDGDRGFHRLWGSRCFDYSKSMVVKFLLSNCRYWLEEYNVDGFRFDGITSMLFKDHGIGRSFTGYADYYSKENSNSGENSSSGENSNKTLHNSRIDHNAEVDSEVDMDALCYLYLANRLIHQMVPSAITIAEDVSGYPGLAAPQRCVKESNKENIDRIEEMGGIGFDYRFAMGIPDFWIKLLKEYRDEQWPLGQLWYELNARRDDEKTISYAECHDQALVGDQTIMMRLMGEEIYSAMSPDYQTVRTFRGVALHKMIRLITLATASDGYLNFMGNEFGHPEWIDFPGAHNQWSYHFARRQWSLMDNGQLYFHMLAQFDQDMINLAKKYPFLGKLYCPGSDHHVTMGKCELLHIHEDNKIIAFKRNTQKIKTAVQQAGTQKIETRNLIEPQSLIFVFNFNPLRSFQDYMIDAPAGKYREVMNSDDIRYGGRGRLVAGQVHFTLEDKKNRLSLYLPARSALVLLEAI
ncbi:MAG: alpha amylase C-terminal domain-containing protein [Desulfamplus sp.]|nr:alpha amylase C-terminal domain-containing protein [Desulfamplus sp.]